MISTVIFDLDGLLADTEPLHCRAYQAVVERHGLSLSEEFYRDCWVRRGLGIADFLRSQSSTLDPAELRAQKRVQFVRLVESRCVAMPGALGVLERLDGHKNVGLASSSFRDAVDAVIGKLDMRRYFGCLLSGNDVQRLKPFPDLFLLAAQMLQAAPEHCVVIEDAEKGVKAARAAGMKCLAVPSPWTADNDFSQAARVLRSLGEVTLELLDAL